MEVRLLKDIEIKNASDLAWKVFLKFEACDYSDEGVKEFRTSIFSKDFIEKQTYIGAFDSDKLIGVIATRENKGHISMFYVDEKYQGQGVGRKLFNMILENNFNEKITVNSSLYALEIYKHFGFIEIDEEKCINGIRYIPMELKIEKLNIKQSKNKLIQDRKKKQKLIADKQRYFDYYDDVKVSSHKIYDW